MATITGTDSADNLQGTDADDMIYGLGGEDTIVGGGGNDTLDGGTGGDILLSGGAGDDVYIVDNWYLRPVMTGTSPIYALYERVSEAASAGFDQVVTSVSYQLFYPGLGNINAGEIEVLRAADPSGTEPLSLGGNEFAQTIIANAGDNRLDSNGGTDTLIGLGGDDSYFVSRDTSVIREEVGGL